MTDCHSQTSSVSTASVFKCLKHWSNLLGWPKSIRSEGGPQFQNIFGIFCAENNIFQELAAPYNQKSNRLAEAAVKNMKNIANAQLVEKIRLLYSTSGGTYQDRTDTASRNWFFGKISTFSKYHDKHKSFLPPLSPGHVGSSVRQLA